MYMYVICMYTYTFVCFYMFRIFTCTYVYMCGNYLYMYALCVYSYLLYFRKHVTV